MKTNFCRDHATVQPSSNEMNHAAYKILFVCMGNICRSPTAEAVFQKRLADQDLLHRVKVDSAGTHNFHPNAPPDERSQAHARKRG